MEGSVSVIGGTNHDVIISMNGNEESDENLSDNNVTSPKVSTSSVIAESKELENGSGGAADEKAEKAAVPETAQPSDEVVASSSASDDVVASSSAAAEERFLECDVASTKSEEGSARVSGDKADDRNDVTMAARVPKSDCNQSSSAISMGSASPLTIVSESADVALSDNVENEACVKVTDEVTSETTAHENLIHCSDEANADEVASETTAHEALIQCSSDEANVDEIMEANNTSSSPRSLLLPPEDNVEVEDSCSGVSEDSSDDVYQLGEAIRRRIAERRAKEAANPDFSKDLCMIQRLEQADGCYVCTMCPLDACFSCWDIREFFEHIMVAHKNQDSSSHTCAYCGQQVLILQFERHVTRHLQQDCSPRFACPLCPEAGGPGETGDFRCNSFLELQLHMRAVHGAGEAGARPLRCVHCARLCSSMGSLFRHLHGSTVSVIHCTVTGCLVKSHNRRVLMRHIRLAHPGLGASILVTTEVVCGDLAGPGPGPPPFAARPALMQPESGSSPPACREDDVSEDVPASASEVGLPPPPLGRPPGPCAADEDVSSLGGGTDVSAVCPPQSVTSGIEPGFGTGLGPATPRGHVFCLRCPYCRMSTIRWPKFLRHQATCAAAGSAGFFHRLFFCSDCFAVSTERQILVDHISSEHMHAQLIEEEVLAASARAGDVDGGLHLASLSGAPSAGEKTETDLSLMGASRDTPTISGLASLAGMPGVSPVPALLPASTPKAPPASPGSGSRPGDADRSVELVSFPFDEEKFREQCAPKHSPADIDRVLEKMRRFCSYSVRILGKENHRRIPQCPECHKAFPYGLGDFKRHLMTVHLDVPREFIRDCLHFTQLPKGEEKFNELQEQLAMRNFRPKVIEPGRKRIPLPFSAKVLRKLTEALSKEAQDYLVHKMKLYSTKFAVVDSRSANKKYKCGNCTYASAHALADVRKHILGSHCGISTKHFRFCLQSSRLDPISFTLLSEDKLLRLAKHGRRFPAHPRAHHLHQLALRRMGLARRTAASSLLSKAAAQGRPPGAAASPAGLASRAAEEEARREEAVRTEDEDEDAGIEGETMDDEEAEREPDEEPGLFMGARSSPDPACAIISAPTHGPVVFPGVMPSTAPPTLTSSTATTAGDEIPLPPVLPALIPASGLLGMPGSDAMSALGAPDGFLSSPSYIPRQRNVDCFSVPTGVEYEETIRLPFSEPVLRRLLSGTCDATTEEMIVERMHVYSSYELTRMGTGSRTLAFKCRCNRIFNTSRLPGRRMRPSTLADTRRHVMGVHARIPHEYLTVCCQASRISRENNWALYSDEMLLKLAADRPTKLMISRSGDDGPGPAHQPRVSRVAPVPASAWGAPSPATSSSVASPGDRPGLVKAEPLDADGYALHPEGPGAAAPAGAEAEAQADAEPGPARPEEEPRRERNRSAEPAPLGPAPSDSGMPAAEEDPTAYLRADQAKSSVDRIISLPYSMEALRYLTDGYCHPDYLDTLREKMEAYACYKVYVTRRSGRRYFCCSGCSASSPHGLGDIRKHIVGVHAKVPERYKAAAMHCSRLSREDNSLLPLNVLLQLSKMKWRGTVIQPIGGRGSLPPSLVTAMANNAASGIKPRGLDGGAKPQPSAEPTDLSSKEKRVKDDEDRDEAMKDDSKRPAAFSMSEPLQDPPACPPPTNGLSLVVPPHLYIHKSRGKFGEVVYNCSSCRMCNRNIGPVRGHIVRDHMGLPGHKCFICGKLYNTKNDVLLHHKVVHPSEEFRLSQYSPYRYAMARVCLRSESLPAGLAAASTTASPGAAAASGPSSSPVSARIKKRRFKEFRFEDGSVSCHFPPPPKRRSLGPSATGVLYPPGFSLSSFPMPPPKAASTEQCYILRRKGGYLGVTFSCNVCGAKAADWDRTRAHVALFHLGSLPFRCPTCQLEHWDHVGMAEHLRDVHQHEREAAILMNCLDATPKPGAFASNPEFEKAMNQVKMVNQRHSSVPAPAPT